MNTARSPPGGFIMLTSPPPEDPFEGWDRDRNASNNIDLEDYLEDFLRDPIIVPAIASPGDNKSPGIGACPPSQDYYHGSNNSGGPPPNSGSSPSKNHSATPSPRNKHTRKPTKTVPEAVNSRRHKAIAAGKYRCERGCPEKFFGTRHDAERHHRDVHRIKSNGEAAEDFPCPLPGCNRHEKPFSRKTNLKAHMDKFHRQSDLQQASSANSAKEKEPTRQVSSHVNQSRTSPPSRQSSPLPLSDSAARKRAWDKQPSYVPDVARSHVGTSPFGSETPSEDFLQALEKEHDRLKRERNEMVKGIQDRDQRITNLRQLMLRYDSSQMFEA